VETSGELVAWLLQMIRFVASYYKEENTGNEKQTDEKELVYDDLYKEALFRIYTQINRIHLLLKNDNIQLNFNTLTKLLKNILSSITIPFSGEPVKGMQIMGFLETRNLDFKNIILLSVNEGILPKSGKESSFIPHNLRKGYGMTTIEHKNSLYAYYFYRFLQRAGNITLVYNTATEGMNKGEMSRFMLQLLAETGFDIRMQDIRSNIRVVEPQAIEVKKTDEIISYLISNYDSRQNEKAYFSPSALNCLINCSLRFYFKYVLRLKTNSTISSNFFRFFDIEISSSDWTILPVLS
jgi:inactivated superfamily I helicase